MTIKRAYFLQSTIFNQQYVDCKQIFFLQWEHYKPRSMNPCTFNNVYILVQDLLKEQSRGYTYSLFGIVSESHSRYIGYNQTAFNFK